MDLKSYSELFDLTGKTAIVTGGVGILGRHFCRALVESGANVVIADIDAKGAVKLADELSNGDTNRTLGIGCDVTDQQSISDMLDRVLDQYGEVNILHNNAAGKSSDLEKYFAPFEAYDLAQWQKIMDVNVNGMFLVAQAVGMRMVKQKKGGSIIQTSSIYGVMAPDNRIYEGSFYMDREINTPAVYSVSKAAIIGLTKYLSTYWAEHNIRVNTISPGGTESGQNEKFKSKYSKRIPLNRMALPSEMVGALLYLASDASSYVTGQNLMVDGGLSAW